MEQREYGEDVYKFEYCKIEKDINFLSVVLFMEPLTKLLAKIDSKLNLTLAIVSEHQTQIPSIVARVKLAQVHTKEKDIHALFFDLEWITQNLLGRKALQKLFKSFQHQFLDLHLLKEELKKQLLTRPAGDALGEAVAFWRKKLLKSLEAVEHDLLIITEKTETKHFSFQFKRTVNYFLISEKTLKQKLWTPSVSEEDVIKLFSYLGEEMKIIDALLSPANELIIQTLRKVLIRDWNELVELMVVIFTKAYPESRPARAVKRKGVQYLEIQA